MSITRAEDGGKEAVILLKAPLRKQTKEENAAERKMLLEKKLEEVKKLVESAGGVLVKGSFYGSHYPAFPNSVAYETDEVGVFNRTPRIWVFLTGFYYEPKKENELRQKFERFGFGYDYFLEPSPDCPILTYKVRKDG